MSTVMDLVRVRSHTDTAIGIGDVGTRSPIRITIRGIADMATPTKLTIWPLERPLTHQVPYIRQTQNKPNIVYAFVLSYDWMLHMFAQAARILRLYRIV